MRISKRGSIIPSAAAAKRGPITDYRLPTTDHEITESIHPIKYIKKSAKQFLLRAFLYVLFELVPKEEYVTSLKVQVTSPLFPNV